MKKSTRGATRFTSARRFGLGGILLLSLGGAAAVGCAWEPENDQDSVRSTEKEIDVTQTSALTIKNYNGASSSDENVRQADTDTYYATVGTANDGTGSNITTALDTLSKFRTRYGFSGSEQIAYYYNRGDLGIGREMHCVDKIKSTGQTAGEIACYVKNFAAGDDGTEFVFGQSPNIAYANMDANHSFATVAMVYRDNAPANKKIVFLVYDAAGTALLNSAALDRTGILFAKGIDTSSTPGEDFNNHIPSNCLNCHGGSYSSAAHTVTSARFLPFDLDQFEYQDATGKRRSEQLTAFKKLNEMVWKVAARLSASQITTQLDGWYSNSSTHQADNRDEVFEGSFDSAYVPTGWNGNSTARDIYRDVIRPACRGCHITNSAPFDSEVAFLGDADTASNFICSYLMPHAIQTAREFWLSSMPTKLGDYFAAKGESTAASTLAACGPGNVATLDPDEIVAVLF